MNYRERLFNQYHSIHGKNIDGTKNEKYNFFRLYYEAYYKKYIPTNKKVSILEIGCNKGYLLAVLEKEGYESLYGIDLSNEDLTFAKENTPKSTLENIDAFEFCKKHKEGFDVIIIKAVLEHINKEKVFLLIEDMKNSLTKEGILIIDVPNMDWLFATHERYMDFTHEVGFTKESLSQVMLNFFHDVKVFTAGNIYTTKKRKIAHYVAKKILSFLFNALDQQGNSTAWADRNLIAVCKKTDL